jgi:synaptotagmin-10
MMDSLKSNSDEVTVSQVAIYITISCIVVSFICVLLYLTCSKRYKLNWFENNLLETAKEDEEDAQRLYNHLGVWLRVIKNNFLYSHEVLVHCGISLNNESSVAGSSRSLNRNISSPTSNHTEDPTFWVPGPSTGGHCSDVHSGWFIFPRKPSNFIL